jgi:hypothetical protein
MQKAAIRVEDINGPILLFSGLDDKIWPSSEMANSIEQRLVENNFSFHIQNIQYKDAGCQISGNPDNDADVRA